MFNNYQSNIVIQEHMYTYIYIQMHICKFVSNIDADMNCLNHTNYTTSVENETITILSIFNTLLNFYYFYINPNLKLM